MNRICILARLLARLLALAAGLALGNPAMAISTRFADPTFDCADVVGKVFDDTNANGYLDQGEHGIAAVRLATARGLLVTTDAEGRFHVSCPEAPNAGRGANFVMKLDERTLPSGYRVTTENPRDVRLTQGRVAQLNFGATIYRVVRIAMGDAAFVPDSVNLLPAWQQQLDALPQALKGKPSVVRIAYKSGNENAELIRRRITAISDALRGRWKELKGSYTLRIETETQTETQTETEIEDKQ
jgi:hypothetical protein